MKNSNALLYCISDGTRNIRITRHSAPYVYKCEAEGQPTPDMAWLMIRGRDGKTEVVSTHALLNVTPIIRHVDDVTLRCFASNVVAGVRYSQTADLTGNVLMFAWSCTR